MRARRRSSVPAFPGGRRRSPPPATAAAAANDYCGGQCSDILPPGPERQRHPRRDPRCNQAFGTQPAHADDQLAPYGNLARGLLRRSPTPRSTTSSTTPRSGSPPTRSSRPEARRRTDVTIIRDKKTGVPHITGTTRYGTEFGAGYAAAQDRLWLMDVFRHVGRGELTPFAGGAPANQGLEQQFWPQRPVHRGRPAGPDRQRRRHERRRAASRPSTTSQAYVAGINAYIDAVQQRPLLPRRVRPDRPHRRGHQRRDDRALQAHRPGRAGLRGRRALRRRRRRRGPARPLAARRPAEVRRGGGHQGLGVLPRAQRPRGRAHRPRRQSFPYAAKPADPQGDGAARRGLGRRRAAGLRPHRAARPPAGRRRPGEASAHRRRRGAARQLGRKQRHVQRPASSPASTPRAATRSPSSARRPATSRRSC